MNTSERLSRLLAVAERELGSYLDASERGERPPLAASDPDELAEELELDRWIRTGGMDEAALRTFIRRYLARTISLHHPRTMGHQVPPPAVPAVVADLVNGVANNSVAVREMAPAGGAVERRVVRWMCERIGFPAGSGGVLTHGGSLANLTAMLAARARLAPHAWEAGSPADLVVLAPEGSHYSVARAAGILGLGTRAVRALPARANGTVDVARLDEALDAAASEGRRVLAVVANAASTGTGLHDDLAAVGERCREHGIWFHVDGAHGASALLSARRRGRLAGIESADSVTWDAHKMLRTTSLCAALLVRDDRTLRAAFAQEASYLGQPGEEDLFHRAIECTKPAIGLKLFLNLAIEGEAALGEHVDRLYARATELAALLRECPDVEVPYEPESNILCFRVGPPELSQAELRRALLEAGDFHVTAVELGGRDYLRLAVMNPLTAPADVEALVERLLALAAQRG